MVWNGITAQFVACVMSTRRQPSAEVYRNGLLINIPSHSHAAIPIHIPIPVSKIH